MKETKETMKISLSTFFLILAVLVIIGMGVYIFYAGQKSQSEISELKINNEELKNDNDELKKSIQEVQDKINTTLNIIGENKIENINTSKNIASDVSFKDITNQINGIGTINKTAFPYIEYTINNDAKEEPKEYKVTLENSKVYFELKENNLISQLSNKIKRNLNTKEEITGFNSNVKEIYYYSEGQSFTLEGQAVMFVMEDKTVEYITLKDLIENDKLISKGQIPGLSDIKKFVAADVREYIESSGGPGWYTTLAVDNNNHYYAIELK